MNKLSSITLATTAQRPRMSTPCRPGVSLHELLVVMSFVTLLIPLSLGWIHRVMRAHQHAESSLAAQQTVGRLVRDVRSDVRRATAARTITPEGADSAAHQVEFSRTDGTVIRYQRDDHGLAREVLRDGQVVSREAYRLPAAWQMTWQVADELNRQPHDETPESAGRSVSGIAGQRVELAIRESLGAAGESKLWAMVRSPVGLHHRFAGTAELQAEPESRAGEER